MRTVIAVILAAVLAGCATPDDVGGDGPADAPGAPDASDGGDAGDAGLDAMLCWLDCFPYVHCHGDLLSHEPAASWHGECGHEPSCPAPEQITCTEGCRGEVSYLWALQFGDYQWLCAPVRRAEVGQGCATDDDCHPTYAIPVSTDLLRQEYLRCAPGGCEVAPAPVVDGYFLLCDATITITVPGPVWVEDPGRGAGAVCIQATDACDRQAASITCDGDWVCPQGSYCDRDLPHVDGLDHGVGVCRPGPHQWLQASQLPCPA